MESKPLHKKKKRLMKQISSTDVLLNRPTHSAVSSVSFSSSLKAARRR